MRQLKGYQRKDNSNKFTEKRGFKTPLTKLLHEIPFFDKIKNLDFIIVF